MPIDIEVDKDEGKNPIAKFVLKDKSFRNDIVRLVIGEQDGKGIFYNDMIFYDEEIVLDNLEYNEEYFLQVIVKNGNGDIIETYTGNFIIENKPSRQVEISNTEKTNYKKYTEVHENKDRDFPRDNDKNSINSSIYRASGYGYMEENESNDEFEDANIIESRVYKVIGTIDSRRDEDFFRKTFAQDGTMDMELVVPRNEDYDIYVYRIHEDEERRARVRNDLENECELIEKGKKGEGTVEELRNIEVDREYVYYIKIVGFGGDYDRNDEYRLYIDSDYDPNAVRRDEYEKNNEADDASKIDIREGRREEIYGTIHHEDDVDWYEFRVGGYSDLDIELNRIPRDCNYDIKLYRKDGRYTDLIESSRRSGDKSEDIRETVEKGTYYVKVYGDGYDDFDVEDEYELEIRYRYNDDDSYYEPDGGVWVSSHRDMTDEQVERSYYSEIIYIPADVVDELIQADAYTRQNLITLGTGITLGGVATEKVLAKKLADLCPKLLKWGSRSFTYVGLVLIAADIAKRHNHNKFVDAARPDGPNKDTYPVYYEVERRYNHKEGWYIRTPGTWHIWDDYPYIPKAIDGQFGELKNKKLDEDDVRDLLP
ncbi:PPC domain-containing protein [Dethiothermospora halolimnae]|uniref:PPC domain-containing protein n=1 Tax=Dethiothermospora halolimnae TaxID=3114390 RepID=UPI003CCB9167